MKSTIALKLLADQLKWSDDEVAEEFSDLQLMIAHKYDGYQGFQPASRFHVSLLNWLSQFETVDQKRIAFDLIKQRLIFITQREMHHLVSLMMPTLDRLMRKQVAKELDLQLYETWIDERAVRRLKLLRRRTLFVGLSDGARIDVFRRYNEGLISNEQVVPFSEMSNHKWKDLIDELGKWLGENEYADEGVLFEAVCLIDDFAGSGASLLRQEPDGSWKGKIKKFYTANAERIGSALSSNWKLYAHHHLASQQAASSIAERIVQFHTDHPGVTVEPTFSYVLPGEIVLGDDSLPKELIGLIKDCYDPSIEDKHLGKNAWFGYSKCGLPLILEHNTPNNSISLLWADSQGKPSPGRHAMKPLFARRKRHSSHG
ncbi:hypothetical protein HUS91_28835 [Pseudomonas chlororaphis]|uniref:phosphoribosyltransferase-like protein n=1 Tax=Pseudomonas chlororaphis TaxID=587753 RepID=UPI001B33A391|nr:hypothetical protein [Pseudomonas chlororaphis]MBP5089499.1 hypothetical protein [Pseudomonas chlororaphis]